MLQLIDKTHATRPEILKGTESAFDQLLKRTDIGFHQIPERELIWKTSEARALEIKKRFQKMVVLGIGGSSLGGRTILSALARGRESELEFFENVDALEFWRRTKSLGDLKSVHFVLISKSGNTMETLSQGAFLDQFLREQGLKLKDQATVVSEVQTNPLTLWAQQNQVPVLEIPKDVGGRFSVLTPVGLLPAAFLGVSIAEIRNGARQMLLRRDLIADLAAQTLMSFQRGEWITLFWSYSDQLATFGFWVQQLWAESLAKAQTREKKPASRVSTPLPLVGANDQHSILQQVVEGAHDKFVWFLRVSECESAGPKLMSSPFEKCEEFVGQGLGDLLRAESIATVQALKQYDVPSLVLQLDRVGPQELGGLFMLFELVIGTLGEYLDIDAYDQPGVELGKRLAREILKTR